MRHVQLAEAETHLAAILEDVERGETVVITRQGKAVARLVPEEANNRLTERRALIAEIKELRKTMPALTFEEIQSAKREGQKP
jgi:prevent-host-death family protein